MKKYCKLKEEIRRQSERNVRQITKEQWEELLEPGKKEGKEDFLRKIAGTSSTQGVNVI